MPLPKSTSFAEDDVAFAGRLEQRLSRLTPDTVRQWGSMNAHEMVCHLADSFSAMLGERTTSDMGWPRWRGHLVRFIALHTPLPWPKGVKTLPEVNPHHAGTRPQQFETDHARLLTLMRRFVAPEARYASHPMFGTMSRQEWMIWTFRHVDHHLRQFGL